MNDLAKRWVAALRSGRYSQTRNCLRDDGGYCILGVLADVRDPNGWGFDPETSTHHLYKGGLFEILRDAGVPTDLASELIRLNDDGTPFAAIADVIEVRLS